MNCSVTCKAISENPTARIHPNTVAYEIKWFPIFIINLVHCNEGAQDRP